MPYIRRTEIFRWRIANYCDDWYANVIKKDRRANGQTTSIVQMEHSTIQSEVPIRLLSLQPKCQRTKQPTFPVAPKTYCYLVVGAAICNTNFALSEAKLSPRLYMDPVFIAIMCNQLRTVHPNIKTLVRCDSVCATTQKIGHTTFPHSTSMHILRCESTETLLASRWVMQ